MITILLIQELRLSTVELLMWCKDTQKQLATGVPMQCIRAYLPAFQALFANAANIHGNRDTVNSNGTL